MVPDLPDPTLMAVPGFIAFMLLELFVRWLRAPVRYHTADSFASLSMGVGNLVEGILLGGLKYGLLLWVYQFAVFDIGWSMGAFVLAYIVDDFRYYWYHRIAHEVRWFWAGHVVHHSSQHYNLSTALRQTWTSTLSLTVLFWIPVVLLGFHPAMLAFVSALNALYQFWIHTEAIRRFPAPIEWLLNTPSHHRVHHARNARYLDANYAGTFMIWDRVFGTFVPEDDAEPCRYGLVKNLATFNPFRIGFHETIDMARDVLQPGISPRDRAMYVVGPPGWSHDGSRKTSRMLKTAWLEQHPEQAGLPGLPPAPPAAAAHTR